jgi:dUTP pyrophosphatase
MFQILIENFFLLQMDVNFEITRPEAIPPTQGSTFSAGVDIYSPISGTVPANGKLDLNTYLSVNMPEGVYGRIAARSSLALNNSIIILGGVIDRDYSGEIRIILFNLSNEDYHFFRGDRIAQIIFEKYLQVSLRCFKHIDFNEGSSPFVKDCLLCIRNSKGFGSTGK